MAGLVPAIHVGTLLKCGREGNPGAERHVRLTCFHAKRPSFSMAGGWVYIVTNRPNGVLYTGVTSDIKRRAFEHRERLVKGFTQRYGLTRLVYMEFYENILDAIQREKNIKHYSRAWKFGLILEANREWRDLYEDLA